MPTPKDITGALTRWEKPKAGDQLNEGMYERKGGRIAERKLNPDIFTGWVYAMLLLTLLAQLAVLASLDIFDLLLK